MPSEKTLAEQIESFTRLRKAQKEKRARFGTPVVSTTTRTLSEEETAHGTAPATTFEQTAQVHARIRDKAARHAEAQKQPYWTREPLDGVGDASDK